MRQRLKVVKSVGDGVYIGVDVLGRKSKITTTSALKSGDFVFVKNGVFVALAKEEAYTTHNV